MPLLRHPARWCVALYFHADEVRLFKFERGRVDVRFDHFVIHKLTPEAMRDGNIVEVSRLVDCLARIVEEMAVTRCPTILGLSSANVVSKRLQLASTLNKTECTARIMANLAEDFPGANHDLVFDYARLPQLAEIQVVASSAKQIEAYLSVLSRAGLDVRVIDVDHYALARLMTLKHHEQMVAVLYFDIYSAQLVVCHQGEMIFHCLFEMPLSLASDFYEKLRNAIQFCQGIQKIFFCGQVETGEEVRVVVEKEWQIETQWFSPFSWGEPSGALLIPYGLSLRSDLT